MKNASRASGQVIFIRTHAEDYAEVAVHFHSLEELASLCLTPRPNLLLDKIIISNGWDGQIITVTLGFIAASRGARAILTSLAPPAPKANN